MILPKQAYVILMLRHLQRHPVLLKVKPQILTEANWTLYNLPPSYHYFCDLPSHPLAHSAPVTLTLLLFPEDSMYVSHLRALHSVLLYYDAFSPHSHKTTSFPSFRTSLTILFPQKYIFPFPALFSP